MSVTFLTSEDEKKFIKSINGAKPDPETGDVVITIPDSSDGADGGHYIPAVDQIDDSTLEFSFTPSKDDMPAVESVQVTLPVSENSGGNVDQSDSVFKGKTASFYGDSLTEVNGNYTKGYHSWVKDLLGLASYNNYGVSGYKVSDVYNKVNSVTDTADIIFVMCGVNDQTFSVPLGAMGDNTTSTTYGALNLLCALLKQKHPTKLVVFITPHYQTKYPHSEGITSYEVSKAVREVCEKYAIPVYDNFVLSGIYSTNFSKFTTDSCHWNNAGHEMVGKNLARFMLNSFRYIYGSTSSGGNSGNESETTVSVTGVTLNASSGTLTEGETVTLVATVLPSNATNKNVTWKSSNNSVATVTGGVVSAISEGTATITATTEDGNFTASYALTVDAKEVVGGINVSATIKQVEKGSSTHIGFLVEGPVGTAATIRLECDVDNISKVQTGVNSPFTYETIEKFNAASWKSTGTSCPITINGNHVSASVTYTSQAPYWVMFVPFDATSVPFTVNFSNVVVYIDDVPKTIQAVGTFYNNSNGTYVDFGSGEDIGDGEDTHTHSYTGTVTTAATCTTAGVKTFTCECGDSYTENIPATGHKWDAGVVTVEPTETTEGVKTYTCTVCGETMEENIEVIGHEHTYVDGVCTVCGSTRKLYEVTSAHRSDYYHIGLYATAEEIPAIDGTVEYGFTLEPVSVANPVSASGVKITLFDVVNDFIAGYTQYGTVSNTVTDNEDGTYTVVSSCTLTQAANKPYWGFLTNTSLVKGDKFYLSDCFIKVNGEKHDIHAIGGAFAGEQLGIIG